MYGYLETTQALSRLKPPQSRPHATVKYGLFFIMLVKSVIYGLQIPDGQCGYFTCTFCIIHIINTNAGPVGSMYFSHVRVEESA